MSIILAILSKIWGGIKWLINFCITHWQISLAVLGIILLIVLFEKACSKPTAKIDEASIQAAQDALEKRDAEAQRVQLEKLDKVANDTAANNAQAAANTAQVEEQIKKDAQKDYGSWTDQQVQEELERRIKANESNN